ncbi:MAG: TolC family protein [Lachnospiraceae bacterium]|nr:TolC family protein [Lachnospiraceae bacterium]
MTKSRCQNFIAKLPRRLLACALAAAIAVPASLMTKPETVAAGGGLIKLSAAKNVAVARSEKIEAIELQITTRRAARDSAVRSLREREHNMRTFRWSPLLNFKFPTKPSEAEAFEFQYKPTQLEYQIKDLQHKITDTKLGIYENVSNLYIQIIQAEQELKFLNERYKNVETALKKAQVKLTIGEVSQEIVDKLSERLTTLKSKLSEQETKSQRSKEKLGKLMGIDLTTGFIFENAFATAEMSRKDIEYLQTYALERDHTVYEAQQNADLALLSLQTNYQLYKSQYGRFIGSISSFVQQAMDGSDVDQKAFQKKYDQFLKDIDTPWDGSYHILFISFPKAWLKGDSDGINWIEDDPKVLFTDTLEYVSARKELENTKEDIKDAISDGYDNYAGARKAYVEADTALKDLQTKLINDEIKNLMGELGDEEYEAEKQEYETAESTNNEALAAYSSTLYSFDRTTCGGVSQFLETADQNQMDKDLNALEGVTKVGAHYSIRSIISDSEFVVTIDVPDYNDVELLPDGSPNPDYYPWNVTDWELRINKRLIGTRQTKDGSVRHLKLDKDNADEVVIRLFDVDDFIDDVVIDPTVAWGPLDITVKYDAPDTRNGVIGTYEVEDDTTTDMIKMKFTFDQDAVKKEFGQQKEAAFYNLSADRTLYLFSDHLVSIDQPFSYLSFIRGDLAQLTMRVFDKEGTFLGGARFDTVNNRLVKDADVMAADMQNIVVQQLAAENKTTELNEELAKAQQGLQDAEEAGDTTTADYYKNRISFLQDQIDHAADNVTDEDLEKVRTEQAEEVAQLTEEKTAEAEKSDEQKAKEAEDEMKKQSILRDAAEELVGKQKYEEGMQELKSQRDAWAYKETELQEKFNQLSKEKGASDPEAKEALAELQAAKRKKRELEDEIKSHSSFNREEFPVSEEEIQEMLNLHPEDVYDLAKDRLPNLDQFAGPAYESAKAEAETYGIETTTENVRFLVGYTEELKQCKAIEKQMEIMKKDQANVQKQMADIKNLPDDDPRKHDQDTILAQLEKVNAAYDNQLEILKKKESKLNPAKVLKRIQLSNEIKGYQAELKQLEAVRDDAKEVFDGETKVLNETERQRTAVAQELEKYKKEVDLQNAQIRAYEALKAAALEEDEDDDDGIAARYQRMIDSCRSRVNELETNLIPATQTKYDDAVDAVKKQTKKTDDAEVPYNAAQTDVDEQNERIDAKMNELEGVV